MRKETFTSFDISDMLEVYPRTVARWIGSGKLKAFKTPGGHHRVTINELLEFLKKYNMPVPESLTSLNKTKILVVDDDQRVVKVIVKALSAKKDQYETYVAVDGFQAGQAVSDHKPDLVVLDIFLPGIDGFKVCKMIKERDKNIKVLAISGYAEEETKKGILSAGADSFMPKPFEVKELIINIEALLKNKKSTKQQEICCQ